MTHDEHEFTADDIDEQLAALAQTAYDSPATPNKRAVIGLQRLYAEVAQENGRSLERVQRRLLQGAVDADSADSHELTLLLTEHPGTSVSSPRQRSRFGAVTRTIAAIVIAVVLVAGFFVFFHTESGAGIGAGPRLHLVANPPLPATSNYLWHVAAVATNDVWVVGESSTGVTRKTLIEHWDGKRWSQSASPDPGKLPTLEGVAAVSADDVWAVGEAGLGSHASDALVEHWDGKQWRVVALPDPHMAGSILWGVAAVSADDVWAVGGTNDAAQGGQPLIEHWNGRQWQIESNPTTAPLQGTLRSVAVIAANDIWAIGFVVNNNPANRVDRALVEHWDGARWSIVPLGNLSTIEGSLASIAAIAPNDIWVTGWHEALNSQQHLQAEPLLEHWDGTAWQSVANRAGPDDTLGGITAVASNDVWVVGKSQVYGQIDTLVEHWDGNIWTMIPSQDANPHCQNELNSVTVVPNTTRIWAAGEYAVTCQGQVPMQPLIETAAT